MILIFSFKSIHASLSMTLSLGRRLDARRDMPYQELALLFAQDMRWYRGMGPVIFRKEKSRF